MAMVMAGTTIGKVTGSIGNTLVRQQLAIIMTTVNGNGSGRINNGKGYW